MTAALTPYSALRTGSVRLPLAPQLPLAAPLALSVETISKCNFKCTMCPVSFADYEEVIGGTSTLPIHLVHDLLSDLKRMGGVKVLRWYGGTGEPLLDRNLSSYIRTATEMGVAGRQELTTNGSALTKQISQDLIESGLDYLRVSVYDQAITQSSIPAEVIRDKVLELRKARDWQKSVTPFISLQMLDCVASRDVAGLYDGVGDEIIFEQLHDWTSEQGRRLKPRSNGIIDAASITRIPKRTCTHPFMSLTVKASGEVVACCVDWAKHTVVGDLRHESIADVWHGERLRAFRQMHLEGRRAENVACAKCTWMERTPDNLDGVDPADFEAILG